MWTNVLRTHVVLVLDASTRLAPTSVSAQEEPGETPMLQAAREHQQMLSVPRTMNAQDSFPALRPPVPTRAPPCHAEKMQSVSQRNMLPGVAARLVTKKIPLANVHPCAMALFVASTPSALYLTVALPVPAPREPLATPSPEAPVCPRPVPPEFPALSPSPVSLENAGSAVTPSHVALTLPAMARPASVSAEKDLLVMETSSVCRPSFLLSACQAVGLTATVLMVCLTSVTAMQGWEATLMRAALRALRWTWSLTASVVSTHNVLMEEQEAKCASATLASLETRLLAVKTSTSVQATSAERTLFASTLLEATTVAARMTTKEIHLSSVSLNRLLRQISVQTSSVDPTPFVPWVSAYACPASRVMLRTQERAASLRLAPTTSTVATTRSASL